MTSAIDNGGVQGPTATPGGPASLAYTDQTEPAVRPLSCAYASDRVIVELHSGQVFPDRCRASQCLFCLPLNARRRALAITLAGPQRMIRLSLVAESENENPWETAKTRIKLIRRNLKRMGLDPGEWCHTIERNPEGTGYHLHCLQRGRFIPQDELQEACFRAHAGIPFINYIRREGQWTSRYGLKGFGADGYGLKTFRPNGDPRDALRINGKRMEHHSTGFFAIDGDVLPVRDMERTAIAALNDGKEVAYIGCKSTNVDRVLGNDRFRQSLIRDVNRRSAGKLRAFA